MRNPFKVPVVDELDLFIVALVLLSFFIFSPEITTLLQPVTLTLDAFSEDIRGGLILIIFWIGWGLCLYHPFVKRKKLKIEKVLMYLFVVGMNIFMALGALALEALRLDQYAGQAPGLEHIVPALGFFIAMFNMMAAIGLIVMIRLGTADISKSIKNREARIENVLKIIAVVFGLAIILKIFFVDSGVIELNPIFLWSVLMFVAFFFRRLLRI